MNQWLRFFTKINISDSASKYAILCKFLVTFIFKVVKVSTFRANSDFLDLILHVIFAAESCTKTILYKKKKINRWSHQTWSKNNYGQILYLPLALCQSTILMITPNFIPCAVPYKMVLFSSQPWVIISDPFSKWFICTCWLHPLSLLLPSINNSFIRRLA